MVGRVIVGVVGISDISGYDRIHDVAIFWGCVLILTLLPCGRSFGTVGTEKDTRDPAGKGATVVTYSGGLVSPPLPKARFTLTDTSAAPFDLWQRRGILTLLFFGYTRCRIYVRCTWRISHRLSNRCPRV